MARNILTGSSCGRRWGAAPPAADKPEGDKGEREVDDYSDGHDRCAVHHSTRALQANSLNGGDCDIAHQERHRRVHNAQNQPKRGSNHGASPRAGGVTCRERARRCAGDCASQNGEQYADCNGSNAAQLRQGKQRNQPTHHSEIEHQANASETVKETNDSADYRGLPVDCLRGQSRRGHHGGQDTQKSPNRCAYDENGEGHGDALGFSRNTSR